CRYNESYRDTPEKIGALRLTTPDGGTVALSQVAEVRMTTGASMITREMNRRNVIVRVNLRGVDLSKFLAEARARIDREVPFDRDSITLEWGGQFENQSRAYGRLAIVVPLALAVMLLLLIVALGKIRMALAIFAMLPLALFGGMLALNLRGMTLNVSSAVGFIALFGVAIQNGVIMLSHINNLRRIGEGESLAKTVADGAAHRFRPILMTASVAVLGLLPASLSTNIGSDVQRPLATVIVYGLLFATVLTLYVLPVLYYAIEKRYLNRSK
ncbi:MAG: efflux RND transporter permease subunit, partial [Muribaculaceae bacterium]|nr:efflux RND transporter permease subunit [Muribaculaceae bacterium]